MSIEEAPFDKEVHARKEGAWVLAYGKSALDQFVEMVKSYFSGAKSYRDDSQRIYEEILKLHQATPPAQHTTGGGNFTMLEASPFGTELLPEMDTVYLLRPDMDALEDKFKNLSDAEQEALFKAAPHLKSKYAIKLPDLKESKLFTLIVGPDWEIGEDGRLTDPPCLYLDGAQNTEDDGGGTHVLSESNGYVEGEDSPTFVPKEGGSVIVGSDGTSNQATLTARLSYTVVYHNNVWYVTDAITKTKPGSVK